MQKQMICIFFGLCLLLSSCGRSGNISEVENTEPESNLGDLFNNADSPKQSQIEDDLESNLADFRSFLTLNSFEIAQSLTENRNYSATIDVVAMSEYAEFQLSADVSYTKYDQGWSMDDCTWTETSYQITNYPTESTIASWIEADDSLTSHFTKYGECNSTQLTESGYGAFTYIQSVEDTAGSYMTRTIDLISLWNYDSESDEWSWSSLDTEYGTPTLSGVDGTWIPTFGSVSQSITISNISSSNDAFDVTYNTYDGFNVSDETQTYRLVYDDDTGYYSYSSSSGRHYVEVAFQFDKDENQGAIMFTDVQGSDMNLLICFHS